MLKFRLTLFSLAVVMTLGAGYAYGAQVENLLKNGGFEDGIIDPWTTYGNATPEVVEALKGAKVPEDPIEGAFCLHITVPVKGANFWDAGLQHRGHPFFEQGKKYTLSVFLKCKEGTLQINFKPELDQDPWPGYGERSFTMTEKWAEYSTTTPIMAARVDPASVTFHIAYDINEFWVDAARFYEGDYVEPEFGVKPKAVKPQDKLAGMWGKIKAD